MIVTIGPLGISNSLPKPKREQKGKSLFLFPSDYVVIDTETTGLEPMVDEIIEFAAIRIRDNKIAETMQTLIKPSAPIDEFIEDLTGITNEMLEDAPCLKEALPTIMDFIGKDILVGHNVNFDINFLYDGCMAICCEPVSNDFVDTMRLSRRLLPNMAHHRLKDIAIHYAIEQPNSHRALADCETTFECFENLKNEAIRQYESTELFTEAVFKANHKYGHLEWVTTTNTEFDTSHPLYGKHCVFTGVLEKMSRVQAAQIVVDLGGFADNGVTKKTNYLILGNNDYCSTIRDGKSSKQKKAEQYKLEGLDIEIISESVFYEMLSQE